MNAKNSHNFIPFDPKLAGYAVTLKITLEWLLSDKDVFCMSNLKGSVDGV
jgi:hypothetical protein